MRASSSLGHAERTAVIPGAHSDEPTTDCRLRIGPDRRPARAVRPSLTHMRIAVIDRRHEQFLDRAGVDPPDQVEDRARLVVGAAGPGSPNGCWPTTAPVGLSLM